MFTLAIPQSDPSGDRNCSASRRSLVKMADVNPCSTRILDGDRVVERAIGHDVEDRRERLLADDRHVGRALTSAGSTKKPGPCAAACPP